MSLFGATPSSNAAGNNSLFGSLNQTTPTTAQQSPNLFSNASTSLPQNSLFGTSNPAASQPNSSTSLFGNTATSASDGPSPLGAPQTTQSASPNLFASASQTASSAPSNNNLFGAPGGNPIQTSASTANNLFGASATTSQPQSGGLFSNLGGSTTTSQNQPASLFSPVSQSASQPQLGAVPNKLHFQPISTAQTQGGGLFGSTNQTSQAAEASLFGSATQGAGAGLGGTSQLGQHGQQNPNQQSQLFNVDTVPQATVFENLLARGKKRREGASFGGIGSQAGTLPSLKLGLGDISSKIKSLGSNKPDFSVSRANESRAQYLLAASGVPQGATRKDLDAFAAESSSRATEAPPEDDFHIEKYVANLQARTTREMMDEAVEQSKRDFDTFLQENLQINWDHQRQRVYQYLGLAKPIDREDVQTSQISSQTPVARGAFGQSGRQTRGVDARGKSTLRGSMGASSMNRSVLGGSIARGSTRQNFFKDVEEKAGENGILSATNDPMKRSKEERYANKIKELNISRIEDVVYPVIEQFARVELEGGSDTPKHLLDAYHALRSIVQENSNVERPSDTGAIRVRQYASDYLNGVSNAMPSIKIRQQILHGSLMHLEESFLAKVEETVDRNPQEANIGGRPTKLSKVRGYLRIREAMKDLMEEDQEPQRGEDGEPIWAMVFFLIRSGLTHEAAEYVATNERVIKTYDRSFPQYIAAYASQNRNIPYQLRSRMMREYQQRLNNPAKVNDPYRMACYKVMGRSELSKPKLDLKQLTVEDIIWTYFVLARESNRAEETAGDTYDLNSVQREITDIKERYFSQENDHGSGYATCFYLQVLAGMFEQAVSWLYLHDYVAAVHFAIALDFYGLLRVADLNAAANELLSFTTREQPQISFSRMIGYYTRDLRLARAEAAADYLILLCLNDDLPGDIGRSHVEACHDSLKDLVLQTREFALLLGDIRTDGQRVKGVIEARLPLFTQNLQEQKTFLRTLTIQAASLADDAGRVSDAVLLYHLAEDYDSVVAVINRALSEALSIDIGSEPFRLQPLKPRALPAEQNQQQRRDGDASSFSLTAIDDPVTLAQNMFELYNSNGLIVEKISLNNRNAAAMLIRMSEARERVSSGRFPEAIDTMMKMELLPMRAHGDINVIRNFAQNLNEQPPVVARNVGNLLIWAIGACGEQRQALQQGRWNIESRKVTENELRTMAKDLMVFAGLIRYRIAGNVYDMLARAGQDVDLA